MKTLLVLFTFNSLSAFADSYQVPSAISCDNGRYELSLENTRALPGQISSEGSENMLAVIDKATGSVAYQAVVTGFYSSSEKIYTYGDAQKKLTLSVKTRFFDRKASVMIDGGKEFDSISFKKCRVYMKKPKADQW